MIQQTGARPAKLAAFDLDGTLLEWKSSWGEIHRRFGTLAVSAKGLQLYGAGKLSYSDFMRMDVSSWPPSTTIDEITEILAEYRIREDSAPTLSRLRAVGFEIAMITGGLDIVAEKVAADLDIDYWFANGLRVDGGGRLTGEGICRVEPSKKHVVFRRLLKRLGIPRENTIAVGDTRYDMSMLREANKGFLLDSDGEPIRPPIIGITRLSDVLKHI